MLILNVALLSNWAICDVVAYPITVFCFFVFFNHTDTLCQGSPLARKVECIL